MNEIAIVRSRIEPGIDRREIPEGPDEDQCGEDQRARFGKTQQRSRGCALTGSARRLIRSSRTAAAHGVQSLT